MKTTLKTMIRKVAPLLPMIFTVLVGATVLSGCYTQMVDESPRRYRDSWDDEYTEESKPKYSKRRPSPVAIDTTVAGETVIVDEYYDQPYAQYFDTPDNSGGDYDPFFGQPGLSLGFGFGSYGFGFNRWDRWGYNGGYGYWDNWNNGYGPYGNSYYGYSGYGWPYYGSGYGGYGYGGYGGWGSTPARSGLFRPRTFGATRGGIVGTRSRSVYEETDQPVIYSRSRTTNNAAGVSGSRTRGEGSPASYQRPAQRERRPIEAGRQSNERSTYEARPQRESQRSAPVYNAPRRSEGGQGGNRGGGNRSSSSSSSGSGNSNGGNRGGSTRGR
ncbi:MAG: hypothetical protein IAF08_13215 [Rhizobacter sp.]|nr:hypothetical protein [Chlorobiales bacterium]